MTSCIVELKMGLLLFVLPCISSVESIKVPSAFFLHSRNAHLKIGMCIKNQKVEIKHI